MRAQREAARALGGDRAAVRSSGGAFSRTQDSTPAPERQGPAGDLPAIYRDGLILVAGRHLASVRDGMLRRSFDGARELLHGGLAFRVDVLELARAHGAQVIVATERSSGQRYRIALLEFARLSWSYSHPLFGAQRALDLARWERLPKEGEAVQLRLLEVGP